MNPTPHVFVSIQQWQIAFIYAFICTFNPQRHLVTNYYKLPDLLPEDIEMEIQKEKSVIIDQYICSCLGNALNRKHPIESYNNALQQIIQDKIKSFEIDLVRNPVSNQRFHTLDIDTKLYLMYCMIEWQLQDSHAVKSIIDICFTNKTMNPIKMRPIGTDSKKRNYWQFGESPFVWRDTMKSKETGWELVCRNKADMETLLQSLSVKNRAEKALGVYITDVLYEVAEKAERKQIRKERAEIRKAFVPEISITPLQLRSRNRRKVNYNYDDLYKEDSDPFEDKTTKTTGTRWSSRLNNTEDGRWESIETHSNEDDVIIVEGSMMEEKTIDYRMNTSLS